MFHLPSKSLVSHFNELTKLLYSSIPEGNIFIVFNVVDTAFLISPKHFLALVQFAVLNTLLIGCGSLEALINAMLEDTQVKRKQFGL